MSSNNQTFQESRATPKDAVPQNQKQRPNNDRHPDAAAAVRDPLRPPRLLLELPKDQGLHQVEVRRAYHSTFQVHLAEEERRRAQPDRNRGGQPHGTVAAHQHVPGVGVVLFGLLEVRGRGLDEHFGGEALVQRQQPFSLADHNLPGHVQRVRPQLDR